MSDLIRETLGREGMEAHPVYDGENGLLRAQSGEYPLVLLDVMLPGIGGLEVLRRLRASGAPGARVPVLMLTARGDELDKVLGLEMGADDYLPKPFSTRELVARIRAILRRSETRNAPSNSTKNEVEAHSKRVRLGDLEIDGGAREARRAGQVLDLTGAEFDLLAVLLQSAGEIVTREVISQSALGRQLMPYDRSIDVHISNLRRKLGPAAHGGERIKAVRGAGYIYARSRDETEGETRREIGNETRNEARDAT